MIARLRRGGPASADAAYLDYLQQTGLGEFRATAGNRASVAPRRIRDGRAEFLLALWDSRQAALRRPWRETR